MKGLLPYLKGYVKESILAPLFKLMEVVFDLLVPLVVAGIINRGVAQGETAHIWRGFALLLIMAGVGLACSITAQYFAAKASVGFSARLRQAVFDHVQRFSFTELDTLGADTLITRITDDINQVQNGVNMGLRLLLRSPFVVFGAMVMAFTIDARCAWIYAVAIPVLFAVVFAIMLISIPLFKRVQAALDTVTRLTRENLTGVRVIRAFCREGQSVEEFEQGSRELTRLNELVGRISALLNPVTYVLINLAAVILINSAAIEVDAGQIAQGDVVALYNYMLQIIVELIKLASLIITLNKAMACAGRVEGILAVEPSMEYPVAPLPAAADSPEAVRFENVSFTYKNAAAPSLVDISFSAARGETIGVIGGTGSGKSTLADLIPRFYDASEGRVYLSGRDVRQYTRSELCARVGVVPQRAVLFKGSIRENLLWGNAEADDEALWAALSAAQAKSVVEEKPGGLDFELEQAGRNLSGGQKQRLTIARALVKRPEILILDDSSSALDFATDAALRRAIHGLSAGRMTTFIISQRIACLRQADKILVLDDGHLAGCGAHDELMRGCPLYREIYFSQFPEERESYDEGGVRA